MKPEHQKHFGGPATETFDGVKPLNHVFVAQAFEILEHEATVAEPGTKVTKITHFLSRKTDPSERLIVDRSQGFKAWNHLIWK